MVRGLAQMAYALPQVYERQDNDNGGNWKAEENGEESKKKRGNNVAWARLDGLCILRSCIAIYVVDEIYLKTRWPMSYCSYDCRYMKDRIMTMKESSRNR